MSLALGPLLDVLATADADHLAYSVVSIPEYPRYFIGKDNEAKVCLLIAVTDEDSRLHAPIRLANLDVVFNVRSIIRQTTNSSEGRFTVVRCRSSDTGVVRYFISIIETLLRILGPNPQRTMIGEAITRLANIFQRLQNPPTRSVNGLFGELFVIRQSRSPFRTLEAWRPNDTSRFDFNTGDVRIDVKTTSGSQRVHTFAYDQCNPPSGTLALIVSLFAQQVAGGISLRELIHEIEMLIVTNSELVLKLHDTVSETLGNSLQEAFNVRFDRRLATSSLDFYDLRTIPALRNVPPAGVSDIHFRSDLSNAPKADLLALSDRQPALLDFFAASLSVGKIEL